MKSKKKQQSSSYIQIFHRHWGVPAFPTYTAWSSLVGAARLGVASAALAELEGLAVDEAETEKDASLAARLLAGMASAPTVEGVAEGALESDEDEEGTLEYDEGEDGTLETANDDAEGTVESDEDAEGTALKDVTGRLDEAGTTSTASAPTEGAAEDDAGAAEESVGEEEDVS